MKQQHIHDDRREKHQAEGYVSADQEKHPANHLKHGNKAHIAVLRHNADKKTGIAGHRGHLQKVQQTIEAEYEKNETEQDAGNEDDFLHKQISLETPLSRLALSGTAS